MPEDVGIVLYYPLGPIDGRLPLLVLPSGVIGVGVVIAAEEGGFEIRLRPQLEYPVTFPPDFPLQRRPLLVRLSSEQGFDQIQVDLPLRGLEGIQGECRFGARRTSRSSAFFVIGVVGDRLGTEE